MVLLTVLRKSGAELSSTVSPKNFLFFPLFPMILLKCHWYIRKPLFQNNLTNLWGSCGNLFFFSISPACTSVMCHSLVQRLSGSARGCVVRIWVSPGAWQTPTLTSCWTHVTVSGAWCYLELLWHRVSHEPQGVVQCLLGFRGILKPVFHYLILCFVCSNLSWKSKNSGLGHFQGWLSTKIFFLASIFISVVHPCRNVKCLPLCICTMQGFLPCCYTISMIWFRMILSITQLYYP